MAKNDALANGDNLELAIMGQAELQVVESDPSIVAADFANRLLNAEDEDSVFGSDAPLGADDLLGVPLFIQNVRWAPSKMDGDGPNVFAIIGATRADDGEGVLITCGGQKVMLRLLAAGRRGLLPTKTAKVFTKTDTAGGRTVLDLVNA